MSLMPLPNPAAVPLVGNVDGVGGAGNEGVGSLGSVDHGSLKTLRLGFAEVEVEVEVDGLGGAAQGLE